MPPRKRTRSPRRSCCARFSSRSADQTPGHAAFEARVPDLVLLAEQVGAVEKDPVGNVQPLVDPAGRIPRRLHVAAMHEPDAMLARQAGRAARPEQDGGERLGTPYPDGETIDSGGENPRPPPPPRGARRGGRGGDRGGAAPRP